MFLSTNNMPLTIQDISAINQIKHKSASSSHNPQTTTKGGNPTPSPAQSDMLGCITYDSSTRSIMISCSSASLTDINNKLHDSNVLAKQAIDSASWLLNANLIIDKGSKFHINSTDTKWLKIISSSSAGIHNNRRGATSGSSNVNSIHVFGSLNIDSVKITSWNPLTNTYVTLTTSNATIPRPYLRIEPGATGTTNIVNSEIAYLGFDTSFAGLGAGGLNYYAGDGSILRGNNIHNLWYGPYLSGVGNMIIEKNQSHHNLNYGFDPHTGSHDIIIRNNLAHDNGQEGIICSVNCSNILFDNNRTYHNEKSGIMLSRNTYNSIVRNNFIYNEINGIHISQSHNNQVYNNTISNSVNGIDATPGSSNNNVHNNVIMNSKIAMLTDSSSPGNTFSSNKIK
jgi:parallel beta-helix repeat protein